MREILFRGKDEITKEWIYGNYCYAELLNRNGYEHLIIEQSASGGTHRVIPETVGQCTELTDKNGNRIFENGYMIIDNKTYKVIFDNAEYILTNIFGCDIITLKNNSIKGVFVDEI